MRLILAATLLAAFALPAQAQRLDTRVREIEKRAYSTECRLNANRDVSVDQSGKTSSAALIAKPVEGPAWPSIKLVMVFDPTKGGKFGVGANVFAIGWLSISMTPPPPPVSVRLLFDGKDSGVALTPQVDERNRNEAIFMVPEKRRDQLGQLALHARWIEVEAHDRDGTIRIYRYDGLRIADAAEIVSIIKFSCDGPRAD